MTTLIGIMPSMQQSTITIPATVKAITGYQAAVVYDANTGKIVNPTFNDKNEVTVAAGQAILPLNGVGAFQKVNITDGSNNLTVTPPTMTATGLSTLTNIEFAANSQLQTIGPKAFLGCSNLTTVNLPNSTNTIGTQAFQNCITSAPSKAQSELALLLLPKFYQGWPVATTPQSQKPKTYPKFHPSVWLNPLMAPLTSALWQPTTTLT